jgi:pilus assembly protein Flp/PilA
MKNLYSGIQRFIRDEEGVTAIEYALIASLIAVVIIVAVRAVGTDVNATFQYIADQLSTPGSGSGSGTP